MSPKLDPLFGFALRARVFIVGRETLRHSKGNLHFILITTDISENSRFEIQKEFSHYPIVQYFTSADIERLLKLRGTKVVGFKKSTLAQSIYAHLKPHRLPKLEQAEEDQE